MLLLSYRATVGKQWSGLSSWTFLHLKSRQRCVFGKKRIPGDRALLLPHKLKDDVVGTLRSVGIEVAAAAAGQLEADV